MTFASISGTLTPVPPFDFDKSLAFLSHFRPALGEQKTDEGQLTKAISVDGQTVVFQVRSTGTIQAPELAYNLYSETLLTEPNHAFVRDRIRMFLSLDDDLRPLYDLGNDDPHFAPIIHELYGYHQVKFLTPFENAVWAILSQRNLMSVSRKMKDGLTQRYGGALELNGAIYTAFPEAFQLALLDVDEINAVVRNLWKSQGVSSVSRAFDGVDETWMRTAPYDDVKKWLLSIKGIGAWSASFILLRSLGRMERLPVDEKWLIQAVRRWYGSDTLESKDIVRLAKPYGDQAGYWAHYLRAAS
jgi:DNA-3-methyladenine glycosylase II